MRSRSSDGALRVALVFHLAPRKLGSMEAWLQDLALGLRERGHSVTVFCRDPVHPVIAEMFERAGIEREQVDQLLIRPLRAASRLRDFDVLHLNFVSPLGRFALLGFCSWPARVLLVDHISRRRAAPRGRSGTAKSLGAVLGRMKRSAVAALARRRLAGVAAVSNYVRADAEKTLGLPEDRYRTIYNGVDPERFRPGDRQVGEANHFAVTGVANLIPAKGIDRLLAAVAALDDPSVTLTVVGDGPERERLERLAVSLGIADRTRFLGLRDDVDQLLRESDLFVHPAIWGEAFGLTIVEAMASGCPVVATDVGGIPELIEDGVSGLLVPAADEHALSRAIERLRDAPDLRRRLSAAGRARAVEHFDLGECVRAHVAWCETAD